MFKSLMTKILVNLVLILVGAIGGYAYYAIDDSAGRLLDEGKQTHRVMLESTLTPLALALFTVDDDGISASLRSLFRFGESQDVLLLDETGDAVNALKRSVNGLAEPLDDPETSALITLRERPLPEEKEIKTEEDGPTAADQMSQSVTLIVDKESGEYMLTSDIWYRRDDQLVFVGRVGMKHRLDAVAEYTREAVQKVIWITGGLVVLILGISMAFLSVSIIRPVRKLALASLDIAKGNFRMVTSIRSRDEIGTLAKNFNLMVEEIAANTEHLKTLVIDGRAIASQVSLPALSEVVGDCLRRFSDARLHVQISFLGSCFPEAGTEPDLYYLLDDKGDVDLKSGLSASTVEAATGKIIRVMDPRGEESLALISLDHADVETLTRLMPTFEAICSNVASAVTTVRLEQIFRLFEERTRDITTVFANIHQGICMLDLDLRVGKHHSAALVKMFGEEVAGTSLASLLERTSLSPEEREMTHSSLQACIGESDMAYDCNVHNFPREAKLYQGETELDVEFEWTPIVTEDSIIQRMMFTVRDVTEIRTLHAAAAAVEAEMNRVREVLHVDPQALEMYLEKAFETLTAVKTTCSRNNALDGDVVVQVKRDLHTLKGTGRTLNLRGMTESLHTLETVFALVVADQNNAENMHYLDDFCTNLHEVVQAAEDYKRVQDGLSCWASNKNGSEMEDVVAECITLLDYIPENAMKPLTCDVLQEIRGRLLATQHQRLDVVAERAFAGARDVAVKDLGKPEPILDNNSSQVWLLDDVSCDVLFDVFNHIFRNTVDHGFAQDSPGVIHIAAEEGDIGSLTLKVWSSEEGIYLNKLEEKARRLGITTDGDSDLAIAELMFCSGMTTAAEVTSVSGRGVGMDAVRALLTEIGGSVAVEFRGERTPNGRRPFCFVVSIPAERVICRYTPKPFGISEVVQLTA